MNYLEQLDIALHDNEDPLLEELASDLSMILCEGVIKEDAKALMKRLKGSKTWKALAAKAEDCGMTSAQLDTKVSDFLNKKEQEESEEPNITKTAIKKEHRGMITAIKQLGTKVSKLMRLIAADPKMGEVLGLPSDENAIKAMQENWAKYWQQAVKKILNVSEHHDYGELKKRNINRAKIYAAIDEIGGLAERIDFDSLGEWFGSHETAPQRTPEDEITLGPPKARAAQQTARKTRRAVPVEPVQDDEDIRLRPKRRLHRSTKGNRPGDVAIPGPTN